MVIFSQYFLVVLVLVAIGNDNNNKIALANEQVGNRKQNVLNKIEVYFCHKVKLTRSSSRACMYIPTQGVRVSFPWWYFVVLASIAPHQLMSQDSVGDTVICPFQFRRQKEKRRAKPFKDFFSEKREESEERQWNSLYFMWPRAQSKTRCLSTLERWSTPWFQAN